VEELLLQVVAVVQEHQVEILQLEVQGEMVVME